jgi:hypothetical protein
MALLVPSTGTFLWVYWHKLEVKEEVKERMMSGMADQELVLLKFTEREARTQLEWEHAGEFEYRGQMYDVVRSEVKGDTTFYYCWLDEAETELNRQLAELVGEANEKGPEKRMQYRRLFEFFQSLYCNDHSQVLPECTAVSGQVCKSDQFPYSTLYYPPPVPPPRRL